MSNLIGKLNIDLELKKRITKFKICIVIAAILDILANFTMSLFDVLFTMKFDGDISTLVFKILQVGS